MATKEQSRKLLKACREGKSMEGESGIRSLVKQMLEMGLDLNYDEPPFYRTALWEATWRNHEQIVKFLFDKGASVSKADFEGRTPLHEAAYYGHQNLVEFFLDKGHPIDVVDSFGHTPLFRAVDGGRKDVVHFLVDKNATTNILDVDDCTSQHIAAFNGDPGVSWWLFYKGAWKNRFVLDENTKPKEAGNKAPAEEGAPNPMATLAPGEAEDPGNATPRSGRGSPT